MSAAHGEWFHIKGSLELFQEMKKAADHMGETQSFPTDA